jgi:hypothetical protein
MTIMPPVQLPTETPAAGSHIDESSTWRELTCHWLRRTAVTSDDSANDARRQAAVRRWRGLGSSAIGPKP